MIRFGLFAALAALVNVLLFVLMGLVQHGQMRLDAMEGVYLVDFIRTPEPDPPPPQSHKPPPPEPPEPARLQTLPQMPMPAPARPAPPQLLAPQVNLELELRMDGGPYIGELLPAPAAVSVIPARALTPLVTLPPRYPPTARARRIEGFVETEFTVGTDGGTADIRIIKAQPEGVFERAAERAIRRWKFHAHRVNGEPMAVRARQRVDFRLESR